MNDRFSRRDFFKSAAIATASATVVAGGIGGQLGIRTASGQEPIPRVGGTSLKISLNAYSFTKLLNDFVKHRGPGMDLFGLLDVCAKNNFDGVDPTGYFFPTYPDVPKDDYVNNLKRRAFELGVGISGTGVRNNFTTSEKDVRAKDIQHIKDWVEVASRLGAPVLRVFSDTQRRAMTWKDVAKGYTRDQVQDWIVEALKECAEHGKKYGVIIGVQNHGDFLQTGQELLTLINAVNSDWCGAIVDTGYFKTADPYKDMAEVAPYAVNWQIKESPFGEESPIKTDLVKLMTIVRNSAYRGYLPIEILSPRDKPIDPFKVVPEFQKQVRDAIAQTA